MKEYARGFNAYIHPISDEDIVLWPNAELERFESYTKAPHFAENFYRHKIAYTLFPQHCIDVVAASKWNDDSVKMYSKIAPVPEDHAPYCSHIEDIGFRKKEIHCDCKACVRHSIFHEQNNIKEKADKTTAMLREWGIGTANDIANTCMSSSGDIIFFELSLNEWDCRDAVKESNLSDQVRNKVFRLLDRYHVVRCYRFKR